MSAFYIFKRLSAGNRSKNLVLFEQQISVTSELRGGKLSDSADRHNRGDPGHNI